jgi:hypothetical protein
MASSAGDEKPKNKFRCAVPEGLEVPLCWCQDPCAIWKSEDMSYTYGRRFFMCGNYDWEPPKVGPYDRRPPVKPVEHIIPSFDRHFHRDTNLNFM